jgi:hypothetical protein
VPLIDERGRLFGRINGIDGLAAAVVLVCIVLGYGSWRLFRTPLPELETVQPSVIRAHQKVTLDLGGANFRPFLHVKLNAIDSGSLMLKSPTAAEVDVPDLPPGTYDLVLYDEARELVRKPGALTVKPPETSPGIEVQLVGRFVGVLPDSVPLLRSGEQFSPAGELLAVGKPEPWVQSLQFGTETVETSVAGGLQVRAVLRVPCDLVSVDLHDQQSLSCRVGGILVSRNTILPFVANATHGAAAARSLRFIVQDVRAPDARVSGIDEHP